MGGLINALDQKMRKSNHKIAIIALGYVGSPLAVEFSKKYPVIGFDINTQRVTQLNKGEDKTLEVPSEDLKKVLLSPKESVSDLQEHVGRKMILNYPASVQSGV